MTNINLVLLRLYDSVAARRLLFLQLLARVACAPSQMHGELAVVQSLPGLYDSLQMADEIVTV